MNLHPDKTKVTIIQSRAEMNLDLISEYAQEMKDGTNFDAVKAIRADNGHFYIYDGAHRVEAARNINYTIDISWVPGTRTDAEWLALSANQKHGLRRSTKDKQRVSRNALLHPNAATLSDRAIAKHCQVDHKTVGHIRANLVVSGEIPQIAERTVTRNGKTFTQAAKAEPEYAAVWQLEEGVKSWLEKALHSANATKISVLTEIKKKTASGKRNLERLITGDIILPGPRRKQDVVQACNNVLDQMEQAAKTEPAYATIVQLEEGIRAWLKGRWSDSPADQWSALHNIKKQTVASADLDGPALLKELLTNDILPGPHRKHDVVHACNNVLDQMNKATKARPCVRCGTTELGEGWHPYGDTRYCGKCWQERKALIEAEDEAQVAKLEAKQAERTAKTEHKNTEALAHIKAYYKDRITKARKEEATPPEDRIAAQVTTPACSVHAYSVEALIGQYQDICPDCLRALGKAMIEAAKEIEFQN